MGSCLRRNDEGGRNDEGSGAPGEVGYNRVMPSYPHIERYHADLERFIEFGGSDNEQSIRRAFAMCLDSYCRDHREKLALVDEPGTPVLHNLSTHQSFRPGADGIPDRHVTGGNRRVVPTPWPRPPVCSGILGKTLAQITRNERSPIVPKLGEPCQQPT